MQEHENILNGKPRLNGQGVAQELVDYDLRLANDAVRPVGTSYLDEATKMPVVLSPKVPGVNVSTWVHHNKKEIDGHLHACGAVLFRGFAVESVEDFDRFLGAVSKNILSYSERSSPRHEVHDKIYTSTDHPSDQSIKMHTENSYAREWPSRIAFYCHQPSQQGGETPIADTRKVWELLSDNTRRKFLEKGILYTRNIGTGFGLNWKEVFQTTDRGKVEEYCQKNGIQFEWKGAAKETITIKFSRPAVRLHPATGARVWFNHSYLFSIYTFPEFIQKIFRSNPDAIPFSSQYGDGSEIEKEVIEEIESIYNRLMVAFTWQKGDILLLDNMLTAHGRKPYKGERKILVEMLDPCS